MLEKQPVVVATQQALRMAEEGADILDIGGESTRPSATPVSAEEEMRRIVPVIEAVAAALPSMTISVDTMKPSVARAALAAGARILNDVSGAAQDPEMRKLAAASGAKLVLMHNRAKEAASSAIVGGEYKAADYEDVVADVARELGALAELAMKDGVKKEQIILDPGIGFGKTPEQNLRLVNEVDQIKALGFPVLLGASRKSFIGRILDLPPEERLEGTAAMTAIATLRGADILRVHDVKFMARVARMTAAIG
jgi:dihydropteroate synthase